MSCYNESIYDDDTRSDVEAVFLNGYLEETEIAGDRHMIDFIKSIMAQERDVKTDMINILKDQILVLRQELFYKQSVIDALLRNYEPSCIHNSHSCSSTNHEARSANRTFSDTFNHHNSSMNCEHMNGHSNTTSNKPVITLYSTNHSPSPAPYQTNLANTHSNHHNNSKLNDPLIKSLMLDAPINSFVTKTVEKFEGSLNPCTEQPIVAPSEDGVHVNGSHVNGNGGRTSSPITSATDLTHWKFKQSLMPSRIPTSCKPIIAHEVNGSPKKDLGKPLSETLMNVRNLLKSNIPRPQKENNISPRKENVSSKKDSIQNKLNKLNGHHDAASKDVISTHKTFRVKFKKDGSQEK